LAFTAIELLHGFIFNMTTQNKYEELLQAHQKLSRQFEITQTDFQKHEKLLRVVFDDCSDVISISRVEDGVFVDVNKSFTELTGYSKEEVLGKSVFEIRLWENTSDRDRLISEVSKTGRVENLEAKFRLKDGSIAIGLISARVINLDNVPHMFTIARNITQIKETESALEKSENLYRTFFDNINLGVTLIDAEHNIVMVNPAQSRMFNKATEFFIGKKCFVEFEKREQVCPHCPGVKAMDTGSPKEIESTGFRDDGSQLNVRILAFPVFGSDNKPEGFIEVVEDITDSKKLEAELQKSQKIEAIGVLAGGIAHDFNNLLTAILGNTSLARLRVDNPDKVSELLENVEKAALRASDLTNQLLTFSKGGAPILKSASIADIIEDSTVFSLRGSSSRCEFLLSDDLWPVKADIGQISQVIHNIALNGIQAMPDGGLLTIQGENKTVSSVDNLPITEGQYVKITISDTGVGIPDKILERVFEPYFTTKQSGSGLGLATCYSIIKQHGGLLKVYSEVGKGSSISIYIPATILKVDSEDKHDEFKPLVGSGKILIMDDEEIIRTTLGQMLEHLGFEVAHANDGHEATEIFKNNIDNGEGFVAVILDLTIPGGMGGEKTIKELKKISPKVKAIVSSGYANDPIMANYKDYGFDDIITKPYHIDELERALLRVSL